MKTCYNCGATISINDHNHIYRCSTGDNREDARYKQICHESGNDITKEYMVELYVNLGWSLPDFKANLGLPYKQTQFLLAYFGIQSRDIKTANASTHRKRKYADTCAKKYGVSNVSKLSTVKDKKARTFLSRYGVDNVWKSEEFKVWYKTYMEDTYGKGSLPNRYGRMNAYWSSKDSEFRKAVTEKMRDGYKKWLAGLSPEELAEYNAKKANTIVGIRASRLELLVEEALVMLDIPHGRQKWIAGKSYDFVIFGTNIILEINGDYWHANPRRYAPDDMITYPARRITARQRWDEDRKKSELAEKYGYKVITIWEDEIRENEDTIELLISRKLELVPR